MATATDYRNMSAEDLKKELIELRREQFNLRMQQGAGTMPKVHRFGAVRKDIARIKTVLNEMAKAGS